MTQLLIATKQLLETLTAWSRQQATEAEVSDVYVRLGSEFNLACRAFTAIGVETSDLGNVPDALRTILESTLSQDASHQSLEVYLPKIREIIINLLHGLKRKQQKLSQKKVRDTGEISGPASIDRGPPPSQQPAPPARARSGDSLGENPPRTSSLPNGNSAGRGSPPLYPPSMRVSVSTNASSRSSHQHSTSISSNLSSPPINSAEMRPTPTVEEPTRNSIPPQYFPPLPPPPPPPPAQEALAALIREDPLQRRATRRYSAYQIAKLTGVSPNGVAMLPTSSNPSALPRTSRDSKESLDAVRVRRSYTAKSAPRSNETSPKRNVNQIPEEREGEPDSPPRVSEKKAGPAVPAKDGEPTQTQPSIKIDSAYPPPPPPPPPPQKDDVPEDIHKSPTKGLEAAIISSPPKSESRRNSSPPPAKDLTLFLQLGRSIKKVFLSEGVDELSLTSLRLLFISKFNYSPPSGEDFPEIYLQDTVSGVRYELEDLRDVKDRAVLCLNIEVLDEVKRHIDDGIGGLKKLVDGLRGSVEGQTLQITRVAERQEEAAKKIAELSVAAPVATPIVLSPPSFPSSSSAMGVTPKQDNNAQLIELRDLRKDLAVLRQVYSTFVADINTSMATIKTKASAVKAIAAQPTLGPNEGRTYVEDGKKTLGTDADALVNRVDDLQDTVEDLRKDVVQRGVRPLVRNLNQVRKEIAQARTELKKMADYIKREKPVFRRVWEKEVELVCQEQDFFNMQENLIEDLQDDLDKAAQTFQLVEQCTEQQFKNNTVNGVVGVPRPSNRNFPAGQAHPDGGRDPNGAKDSILSEVRALQPNHESRLEAIERAEKLRQKELESRVPEFQKELGEFVVENKLKKAGGVDEVERLRTARDEKTRREVWERKKQMEEEERAREEEGSEEEDGEEEE